MIDKRLKRFYEDACDILDSLNIEYGPVGEVTVNTRAKNRWGQCCYLKVKNVYNISISSRLLQSDIDYTAMMDTMIHELLHCHKDRMCHTGEWKRCANLVNMYYEFNIKRTASAEEKNLEDTTIATAKYKITCNKCGAINYYIKKGKVIKALLKNPNNTCSCKICNNESFTVECL